MANMKLLRIYTDEAAYFGDERAFEVVAARVRVANLAGVTVVRALFGFGHSPHRHRHLLLEEDQPLVIEIIDEEVRLRAFAVSLADISGIGLMTLEAVEILFEAPAPSQSSMPPSN